MQQLQYILDMMMAMAEADPDNSDVVVNKITITRGDQVGQLVVNIDFTTPKPMQRILFHAE